MAEHQRHLHSKWPLLCGRPLPALLTPAGPTHQAARHALPLTTRGLRPHTAQWASECQAAKPTQWRATQVGACLLRALGPAGLGPSQSGVRTCWGEGQGSHGAQRHPWILVKGQIQGQGTRGLQGVSPPLPYTPARASPSIPQSLHLGLRDKDEALERRGPPISTGESQPPPGPANVRGTWSFRPSL